MNSTTTPHLTEVNYDPFDSRELARAVPTTEAQRELWLADQLGREASLAYNESVSLLIDGGLDVAALQDALLALADRHEALRSTLSADGTNLMIVPRGSLQARLVDLSSLGEAQQEAARTAARRQAVSDPFDLVEGPLVCATLMKLGAARHELLLTAHHIVCDGWSFGVVASELTALYALIVGKQDTDTMPMADSFGDYAVAQHSPAWLAAADADTSWWVHQYDGAAPVLELPTDRPRSAFRTFNSQRETLELDATLVDRVRRLGSKHGASLFVTLFGAFAALLSRLSGQHDVVVGVPAAGQASDGRQALVGHCVQVLPIRVGVDLDAPFAALLASARTHVLDAYEHQACTFGQLLKKLQVQRDPARLPLVSVLFNLDQAIRSEHLSVAGLKVELRSNPRLYEIFDLFVNASQIDGRIVLECQYNTDLHDAASVRRWLSLYRQALQRLVAGTADAALSAADALAPTTAELDAIARWNASALDHEHWPGVHELIARQVAATPEHIAVVAGNRRLSYRQLDQRANALAHVLRERGVRAGHLVGLSCGRNEHMLVGLLGILKAGAGYVPMDPAFPAERLEYMRTQSGAAIVVSDSSVAADETASAQRLLIDQIGKRSDAPACRRGADDLAYVIYTSGSTGKPKGVRVPHRSVVNLLASMAREPGMSGAQTVLSVTTLSFDIAVAELVLPLSVGATIVVADRTDAMNGDRLRALIESEGVDFVQATPSTWRLLLAAGWAGGRQVKALCGGEPLPPDLAGELLPRVGELWNCYGPTETTVWSSFHRVLHAEGTVPIGHPAANTQLHVVDANLRALPVGVVGEIFIGGEGVTLGYHGRPDLTAERFLPDPHRPGQRWYKTGDLGRWRADGTLECLGRSDHQVKVRGYRIELGEIEATLLHVEGLQSAVVITREDEPGDVTLAAYVVPHSGQIDTRAIRERLRQHLPDYMIPRHVVQLGAIPLLPNGKTDRKSLPAVRHQAQAPVGERAEPGTALETQVLRVFEGVLSLPGLGIDDDFFALGGHSLLAAKLASLLARELGRPVSLRAVFDAPSVRAMARALSLAAVPPTSAQAAAAAAEAGDVIAKQPEQSRAPLTLAQEGIRLYEELYPGRVTYNTPSAHRLSGPLDERRFKAALAAMVERNTVLRTVISNTADGPVQEVMDGVGAPLRFEDLSALPADRVEAELMKRMQAVIDRPIDIQSYPLFRAVLYRLAVDEHVFLFMPHHIIWDGWSFDLLYDEMAALYPAALSGTAAAPPAEQTTYVDYAHWHRQWMAGADCAQQLAHWKQRFANVAAVEPLPTDKPRRRAGDEGSTETEWIHVGCTEVAALHAMAARHSATANMAVLAVYAAMLAEITGCSHVVLGVPVRGRMRAELESVMGLFVNIVPVVITVDSEASIERLLPAAKHALIEAMANQEIPFDHLSAEPEFVACAKAAGSYQSLYSFQDARARVRQWGPLEHENIPVMQKGSPAEFGLWLLEGPDGFMGGISYNTSLWNAATAALFKTRLLGLLARVVARPAASLRELLAEPGPDHQALATWLRERRSSWTPNLSLNAFPDDGTPDAVGATARQGGDAQVAQGAPAVDEKSRMEARMADIWADLLGVDPTEIRSSDNFFDLGGSSLVFMRLLARMKAELGLRVEPKDLLTRTLGEVAAMEVHHEEPAFAAIGPANNAGAPGKPASGARGSVGKLFGPKRG